MKKIIFFSLILLALGILPSPVLYAQDIPEYFVEGDWVYQDNGEGWTIVAYSGHAAEVEIPFQFHDIYVTRLAEGLFSNDLRLEKVIIPSNVTTMGKNTFLGCVSLKQVTLPYLITSIPEGTFKGCVSLESITLPSTVTSIGKEAISGCTGMKQILLPKKVNTIGEAAFENCTSLVSVQLATSRLSVVQANAFRGTPWLENQKDEFVYIGRMVLLKYNGNDRNVVLPYGTLMVSNAFQDNQTLETIVLPETVRRIGQYAFKNAVNLRSVNVPQYVTTIDSGAFEGCRSLESIELPALITGIGSNAFNGCERLRQLVFPPKVKNIQSRVAGDCPMLTDVRIPADVTNFHKNAFLGSDAVKIQIAPESAAEKLLDSYGRPYSWYVMQEGDYFYSNTGHGVTILKYTGTEADVEVPLDIGQGRVTKIGAGAFQNNSNVRRVILPAGVVTIDDWAFSYMPSLEYVRLPIGLKTIGENAFTGSVMMEIVLPNRLSGIGENSIEKDTRICAKPGTDTDQLLLEKGYYNRPMASCGDVDIVLSNFGDYNTYVTGSSSDGEQSICSPGSDDVGIIQIPNGMTRITRDLIRDDKNEWILIVPDSVTEIDPQIYSKKKITLVGNIGSYAESFARENGLKFIVRVNTSVLN